MSADEFALSRAALATLRTSGARLTVWWRDDDARLAGPALSRLLRLRTAMSVPLSLAAIPEGAGRSLAAALPDDGSVRLLLHGWSHRNHAPVGEKRAEFGDHRPLAVMLAEISQGRARLAKLGGPLFLPIFVPPWNRIGAGLAEQLPKAGIEALSTFRGKTPPARPRLDTHLDIMNWDTSRGIETREADRRLAASIGAVLSQATRDGSGALGLLSHHLQHDEAAWSVLEAVLAFLARQDVVSFVGSDQLLQAFADDSAHKVATQ